MSFYDRSRVVAAAQSILDRGGWCVFETCTDVPAQQWEARVVIFDLLADAVADAVAEAIDYAPGYDARLTGCNRRTLQPDADMGHCLCYVSTQPEHTRTATRSSPRAIRGLTMLVRDGMNPVVVTIGPEHTLREAARRMTARGVGAAIVIDDDAPGPGILTERAILNSNGIGQCMDDELVRRHLTSELIYVAADWPLERAAAEMVSRGLRHVIVLYGANVTGILSMRDIVRCWISDGAGCEGADLSSGRPLTLEE